MVLALGIVPALLTPADTVLMRGVALPTAVDSKRAGMVLALATVVALLKPANMEALVTPPPTVVDSKLAGTEIRATGALLPTAVV
jgi:hypothetical protein